MLCGWPQQLFLAVLGQAAEHLVGVGDAPLEVGLRDDDLVLAERAFYARRLYSNLGTHITIPVMTNTWRRPRGTYVQPAKD
jgi:hypothetical protein